MNYKAIITLILGLSFVAGNPVQPLDSCITCSSRTDLACATDPNAYRPTTCVGGPVLLGCYSRIIDGFTLRGCAAELDADILKGCQDNTDRCSICTGPPHTPAFGCNNHIFPVL